MKENFEAIREKLEALPEKSVIHPTIPVEVLTDEGIDLHFTAKNDAEKLAVAGITEAIINELMTAAHGLRYLESIWIHEYKILTEGQKLWKDLRNEALELRAETLHFCRFVFRNDEMKMKVIQEIAKGRRNADLIQDLSDLTHFCELNKEALLAVNFSEEKMARIKYLLAACSEYMGIAHEDTNLKSPSMLIRNRAFTYLKQLIDEVRVAGKFVFRQKPDRLKLYASEYRRKLYRSQTSSKE